MAIDQKRVITVTDTKDQVLALAHNTTHALFAKQHKIWEIQKPALPFNLAKVHIVVASQQDFSSLFDQLLCRSILQHYNLRGGKWGTSPRDWLIGGIRIAAAVTTGPDAAAAQRVATAQLCLW